MPIAVISCVLNKASPIHQGLLYCYKFGMNIAPMIAQIIKDSMSSSEQALLAQASISLSNRYREGDYKQRPPTLIERYAYLLARFPATLEAVSSVLSILKEQLPNFAPRSVIDVGAGPATASWAALELFDFNNLLLIEKDAAWIALGKKLASHNSRLNQASWLEHDLNNILDIKAADLIIASYSFQELASSRQESLALELYRKTLQALVFIEPGTPRGFANIRALREILIKEGAHIIGPCSHESPCPLVATNWCHFSVRLSRHELHRRVKNASMGYEDEKYSYLIVSPHPAHKPYARVLRPPQKRTGHVILDLCSESEQKQEIITRSQKNLYREAKKLRWGDSWNKN